MPINEQLRDEYLKFYASIVGASLTMSAKQQAICDFWLAKLEEAIKEAVEGEKDRMSNVVKEVTSLAQKFIEKVESGRTRSKETYADMKRVVELLHPHSKDEKLSK